MRGTPSDNTSYSSAGTFYKRNHMLLIIRVTQVRMEEKRRRQSLPLINVNSFLNLQKMKSSLADLHDFRCSLSASQKKLENFRAIVGLKVTVCSHYIAIIIRKAAIHLKPLHFIHLFSTPFMLLVLFNKNQHFHLSFNPKISTFFFFLGEHLFK